MKTSGTKQDLAGDTGNVRASIDDAAANWLVRRQAGFSAGEESEFNHWLSSDPRHSRAFASVEAAWNALSYPRLTGCAKVALGELHRRSRRRVQRRAWAVGLAGLAMMIGLYGLRWTFGGYSPHARAGVVAAGPGLKPTAVVVEPAVRHLPDGSVVELNAGAEFTWNFSGGERIVWLSRGEASFTVAKDAVHPFLVVVSGVTVRAVGTMFTVNRRADNVDVLVTEGAIKVELQQNRARPAALPARQAPALTIAVTEGEHTTISLDPHAEPPRVTRVSASEVRRLLAWHSKRIEFTGTPLLEAVKMFNRENRLQLSIGDPSIGNLQITGVYWVDDPDGFIDLLKSALDLNIVRESDHVVVLRAP